MTRQKVIIIVTVIALAFAGIASWGVYSYLQRTAGKTRVASGKAIVVAAADIPVGTQLDISRLKLASWSSESIPPGSFSDVQSLAGRVVVRHLSPGDSITEQKLIPREGSAAAGVMSYIVPQGHRAVTVGVNEVAGVAGFIAPQNRVDVVLTTKIPGTAEDNVSKIVLQDIPVLATGQITEQKDGKPVVVPTVTLDLAPQDAEKLILASSKGSLQLLLRNVIDTELAEAKGATIAKVLGSSERAPVRTAAVTKPRTQAVARPAAPSLTVEIFKGKERSTREFAEI